MRCRALDEAIEAVSRAEVAGQGERKKGEKAGKDAQKRRGELEGIREKMALAEEEFKGMEEKAFEVPHKIGVT